ncbi:MAG: hypothetical protein KBS52_04455 [Clostridiales bacterium]|nr:hypothetical protein [Candidatus Equinaster intestinalis]
MSEHKNEILEQQRKARREFIELKKMQSGEIAPPPKPSEEAKAPETAAEKRQNFWYHYKWQTIAVIAVILVLAIGIAECVKRPDYDAKIVVCTESFNIPELLNAYEDYIKEFTSDINGDGEVNVLIIDCAYTTKGKFDSEYVSSLSSKLQALIATDGEIQLFIVDDAKKEYLNSISSTVGDFFVDEAPLGAELYEKLNAIAKAEDLTVPQSLIIGRRVVKGTLIENVKNIEKYTENSDSILQKIKSKVAE